MMTRKKAMYGILAMMLVFTLSVMGCGNGAGTTPSNGNGCDYVNCDCVDCPGDPCPCKDNNGEVSLTGIAVSPSARTLYLGGEDTVQLSAAPVPHNANLGTVTWISANAGIAAVDAGTGIVTAVAVGGPVRITASYGNASGYMYVEVKQGDNNGDVDVVMYGIWEGRDDYGLLIMEFVPSGTYTLYTAGGWTFRLRAGTFTVSGNTVTKTHTDPFFGDTVTTTFTVTNDEFTLDIGLYPVTFRRQAGNGDVNLDGIWYSPFDGGLGIYLLELEDGDFLMSRNIMGMIDPRSKGTFTVTAGQFTKYTTHIHGGLLEGLLPDEWFGYDEFMEVLTEGLKEFLLEIADENDLTLQEVLDMLDLSSVEEFVDQMLEEIFPDGLPFGELVFTLDVIDEDEFTLTDEDDETMTWTRFIED